MKIVRSVFISAFVVLILIQFYPNPSPQNETYANDSFLSYFADSAVVDILKTSCFDCHSNHVHYPWYSHVAPASWLIYSDIREGRKKLNFSEWKNYPKQRQIKKLTDIKDEIGDGMPLALYTFIHHDTKLTNNQKKLIGKWCDDYSYKIQKSKN